MSPYLAIGKIRASALLQYRSAAFAGVCTQFFWGLVLVMIYSAFYQGNEANEPLSLQQTLTFIWIVQAIMPLLPWHADKDLAHQVRSGQVAYELIRPLRLYGVCYARAVALRLMPLLMRSWPIFLIAGVFLDLQAPASLAACLGFIFSLLCAIFLSAAITSLITISLFWTISGEGINRFMPHFVGLMSGSSVPLPLFPSWAKTFMTWQPFRGVIDIPCRIYTGVIPAIEIPLWLGFQLAWTALLICIGSRLLAKALCKLTVQGG